MVEAFVLVRVELAKVSEFLNLMKIVEGAIRKTAGLMEIKGVFGRFNFIIRIKAKTFEDLGNIITDCIRSSHGVAETETLLVGHLETSPSMKEMVDKLVLML
jgi:DNA-binding Lrp family transcriptional regulator